MPSGHAIGGCGSNAACADPMGRRPRGRTAGSAGDCLVDRGEDPGEEFGDLGVRIEREDAGDVLVGTNDDHGSFTTDPTGLEDVVIGQAGVDLLDVFEVE